MKFSTQEVMEAPIEAAFELLADFDHLERTATQKGAQVRRVPDSSAVGGMAWEAMLNLHGRQRSATLKVVENRSPHQLNLEGQSQGLRAETNMELHTLTPERTRVIVSLELRPTTMAARLLLQSLKLAKPRLTLRYKERVAHFVGTREQIYRATR